jgi:hypothetical protein
MLAALFKGKTDIKFTIHLRIPGFGIVQLAKIVG